VSRGLPWLDDLPTPTSGGGLRFRFKHGHPEPQSLFTFRVLPARWLADRGKSLDDTEFAARPFGTGPYRIHSLPDPNSPGRRELALIDNPHYGRWRDRAGQPHIREVRLVDLSRLDGRDPFDEFRRGELHFVPDLSPTEMTRLLSEGGGGIGGKGRIVTAQTNRRVHILAINHRRPYLQNKDLRLGLSQGIDRDGIVFDLFRVSRAEHKRFTGAMTGPFPPGSWATVKGPAGQPIPLMNRDQALVHFTRYFATPGAVSEVRLAHMAGDPSAESACTRIKGDIESLFKDASGTNKLTVILDPLPPRDFLRRLEEEHRYDLAYIPFDYPDDWYPFGLASFLDPAAAGRSGRNVTGFLSPGTSAGTAEQALGSELAALREHRDFRGDLAPRAERIHRMFNESVPFVPLWHLDRHSLVYTGLKVYVDESNTPASAHILDPAALFANVARWRLE
jgi:ABC-type oligopeptide transport system substrate-binding subunit